MQNELKKRPQTPSDVRALRADGHLDNRPSPLELCRKFLADRAIFGGITVDVGKLAPDAPSYNPE